MSPSGARRPSPSAASGWTAGRAGANATTGSQPAHPACSMRSTWTPALHRQPRPLRSARLAPSGTEWLRRRTLEVLPPRGGPNLFGLEPSWQLHACPLAHLPGRRRGAPALLWGRRPSSTSPALLRSSAQYFADMNEVISTQPPLNMGSGWETKRLNRVGEDWLVLRLGQPGVLRRVEPTPSTSRATSRTRLDLTGSTGRMRRRTCCPTAPTGSR